MLRRHFTFIVLWMTLCLTSNVSAQDFPLQHYLSLDLKTNGFGMQYNQVHFRQNSNWHKSISTGVGSLKHPREIKISNPNAQNPRPYVFGKLNKTAIVHVSPGLRFDAIPRHKNNTLGLSFLINVGPEVAILKPVYLKINHNNQGNDGIFISNERYDPDVHTDQSKIEGYSRSKFGWNELSYQFGIHASPAVLLEWGKDQYNSKAIMVGSRFDLFFQDLPIMANKTDSQAFGAFYIQFMWGFIKL